MSILLIKNHKKISLKNSLFVSQETKQVFLSLKFTLQKVKKIFNLYSCFYYIFQNLLSKLKVEFPVKKIHHQIENFRKLKHSELSRNDLVLRYVI